MVRVLNGTDTEGLTLSEFSRHASLEANDERSMTESRDRPPEESFRPYRQLAIRVLLRALRDVVGPNGASADRESARIFLNGSSMLLHWCHVAALDPTVVASLAEKLAGTSGNWTTRYDETTRAGHRLPDGAIPYPTTEFLRIACRVGTGR